MRPTNQTSVPQPVAFASQPSRRARRWRVLALLAVAAGVGWWVVRDQSRAAERTAAIAAARARDPDAPARLAPLLARSPDDIQLLDAVIDWHLHAGTAFGEIEPLLNRLCAVAPTSTDPLFLRAKLRVQNGHAEDGLADARRVLELDPNDLAARRLIAVVALNTARYPEAIEQLVTLLGNATADRELARMLVDAHLRHGDAAAASRAVERFFPATDASGLAGVLRGRVHQLSGRTEDALAALRQAAKAPNQREEALYWVTEVLRAAGRGDELTRATDELTRAKAAARLVVDAAQRPDDLPAQLRAAEYLIAEDRAAEAMTILDRAATRHGMTPTLARALARACRAAGRPDLAAHWDRLAER